MPLGILKKIFKRFSDPSLIKKAYGFAEKAHKGQMRASGEEYISHPVKVAETLIKMNLDPQTIAAGFLHDVPEDTDRTIKDIEKEFGKEIAFLVDGVSKLGKLRYPKKDIQMPPIANRKDRPVDIQAENLRKMFFAMAEDIRVMLIKLADRLHNMQTLYALPPEKQKRIALETLEIFAPLANRLGMGEMKGQLEDLAFPYLYPKEYQWLIKNIESKYGQRNEYLEKVKKRILEILKKERIKPIDIHARIKHHWSLYQKLLKHDMDPEKIYDLVALRIILKDVATCYKALGAIHEHWKPLPGRIKDYIAIPKPNDYRALHTTVFCIDGKITEFQIKTPQMHREAEFGICAHWAKKEKKSKKEIKKFAWVAQLRDWQKETIKSKDFWEGLKIDFFKNRIFVFTPRGDVIDLPEGACPIDFAYSIHTDVGNHCAGAKINKKLSSLSKGLKNGDEVEIIIDRSQKPSRDWLEFVKTNLARSHIKSWLKKESRPENLSRGLKLLDEKLKELQGISWQSISKNKKEKLLKKFSYKDVESLTVAVGEGELSPQEIFRTLFKEKEFFLKQKGVRAKPLKAKLKREIVLAGQKGIKMRLAKCCSPEPNDKVAGYITKSKEATVHRIDCKNFKILEKKWPQKIIEASWEEENYYPVSIEITAKNNKEILKEITSLISATKIKILAFNSRTREQEKSLEVKVTLEVRGIEQLDKIFKQLKQIEEIKEIRKV